MALPICVLLRCSGYLVLEVPMQAAELASVLGGYQAHALGKLAAKETGILIIDSLGHRFHRPLGAADPRPK